MGTFSADVSGLVELYLICCLFSRKTNERETDFVICCEPTVCSVVKIEFCHFYTRGMSHLKLKFFLKFTPEMLGVIFRYLDYIL